MFVMLLGAAFFGFSWYVRKRVATYEESQTETHNRFVQLLVNILVTIARSDGHFTKSELQTMLNFFQHSLNYNQDQMYWVKQLIKEAKDTEQNLDARRTGPRDHLSAAPDPAGADLPDYLHQTTGDKAGTGNGSKDCGLSQD